MHLHLTILHIHNTLTMEKWAAGLIDGGRRTVSDGVRDKGLYDNALEFKMKSLFLSFMDGSR
jgi:hypothetical protein